jgi:hypothetical protein
MSKRAERVAQARQQADMARLHFIAAIGETKARLAPQRLKDDALIALTDKVDEARTVTVSFIRQRPVLIMTVVGTLSAIVFWRPARATGRTFGTLSAKACNWMKQWRNRR